MDSNGYRESTAVQLSERGERSMSNGRRVSPALSIRGCWPWLVALTLLISPLPNTARASARTATMVTNSGDGAKHDQLTALNAAVSSHDAAPQQEHIVFLQGIGSALMNGVEEQDPTSPCPNHEPFGCIKQQLSDSYGYASANFLEFSFNGNRLYGSQADYPCELPSHIALNDSAANLRTMLSDYLSDHPDWRFILVGHSLGGDVAFRYLSRYGTDPTIARVDGVITLDSQLAGTQLNGDILQKLLLDSYVRIPPCSTGNASTGPAISDLNVTYHQSLQPRNTVRADLHHAAQSITSHGGAVYTLGNWQDTLFLPIALIPKPVYGESSPALRQTFDGSSSSLLNLHCSDVPVHNGCGHLMILQHASAVKRIASLVNQAATHAPGGMWVSPANGSVVKSALHFAAQAYPTNVGGPAIDHVNFTADYGGGWHIVNTQDAPTSGNIYSYVWDLSGVPSGPITISFDVYDRAGHTNLSPNGLRTVTHDPGGPGGVWVGPAWWANANPVVLAAQAYPSAAGGPPIKYVNLLPVTAAAGTSSRRSIARPQATPIATPGT